MSGEIRCQFMGEIRWGKSGEGEIRCQLGEIRCQLGNPGRVDLGGCPPKSPTDPGLHITRTRFLIS